MWKFIFRQNWWNNTPKHNDTWTHSPKTVSWVNNCSSKKCPHLNRDRPNCRAMWHKPSLPLCWGITVTMNGSRVHSGMERNNAQRKLPVLVQLTTETFILLVIFFFFTSDVFPDLMFAASAFLCRDVFLFYLYPVCSLLSSLGFCTLYGLLYLSLHFQSQQNPWSGNPFWHTPDRMEQEHNHSFSSFQRHYRGQSKGRVVWCTRD